MSRARRYARPRPHLSLDQLVEAAIALLDEEGLDGLTTRALAARLGVQSPALYWYIRDKGELLDLVADAICAPVLDATTGAAAGPGNCQGSPGAGFFTPCFLSRAWTLWEGCAPTPSQ